MIRSQRNRVVPDFTSAEEERLEPTSEDPLEHDVMTMTDLMVECTGDCCKLDREGPNRASCNNNPRAVVIYIAVT